MITNEDKHQQAVTMILAATHKKHFAEALLEEAERELREGKKLLGEQYPSAPLRFTQYDRREEVAADAS